MSALREIRSRSFPVVQGLEPKSPKLFGDVSECFTRADNLADGLERAGDGEVLHM
jgi:hypothetical protein